MINKKNSGSDSGEPLDASNVEKTSPGKINDLFDAMDSIRKNLRPGGPDVDYEAIHLYFAGKLNADEAATVRGAIVSWEAWNKAYWEVATDSSLADLEETDS